MKTEVTITEIYWNKGLADFFFREQAMHTLEELVNRSQYSIPDTLSMIDDIASECELDDVEEDFYNLCVEEMAEQYGIDIQLPE